MYMRICLFYLFIYLFSLVVLRWSPDPSSYLCIFTVSNDCSLVSLHSMPKPSQDLPTQSVVKHSTNGLDTEQKASSTSFRTASTETRAPLSTTTVASVQSVTRTEEPKITPTPSSQPISISTDGRSAAGQKTLMFVNERSRNVVKKESHGKRRAPEEIPEASQQESSGDSTKESTTDFLETPPTFESQPESQEAVQGQKVTFRCQGELMN